MEEKCKMCGHEMHKGQCAQCSECMSCNMCGHAEHKGAKCSEMECPCEMHEEGSEEQPM